MATKRKRSNRFKVGPAPSSRGFEDTPENRQRIKDLGWGSILDDAGGDAAGGKKRVFKPRPRNRRPGLGAGGSPSKRTRGYRRPKKKDYTKDLPRPTKSISSEIDVGIDSKPVIASTPEPEAPLMPTRPPSQPWAGATLMPHEELSRKAPSKQQRNWESDSYTAKEEGPLYKGFDPFTKGATSPEFTEFKEVEADPFSGLSGEFGAPMREQPPIQVQQPDKVPDPLSYRPPGQTGQLPMTQETYTPAPKTYPLTETSFKDPFNLPTTDPMKVPLFGIRKPDGTFFSPEETRLLFENNTLDELKAEFGEAAIINILEGAG